MAYRDRYGITRRDTGAVSPFSDLFASPFGLMRRMADEMNQTLNQGMGAARDLLPFGGGFPAVDVRETAGSYVVEAELPGVKAQDIEVTVQGDTLILKGEASHEQEQGDRGQGYYVSERRFGSFHREIPLPGPVDENNTTAHFENGVLEIRLPKTGQEQGHRIRVEGGAKSDQQGGQDLSGGGVSQVSVESSTGNQSFAGEASGKSASESARAFQGESQQGEKGGQGGRS